MANYIGLNGNYGIKQPTTVQEDVTQKVVDRVSIKGVTHRYWEAQKHKVVLTWNAISIGDANAILGYFYGNANPVTYSDIVSGYSFSGFATASQDTFMPGASFLKNLTLTIVEQ